MVSEFTIVNSDTLTMLSVYVCMFVCLDVCVTSCACVCVCWILLGGGRNCGVHELICARRGKCSMCDCVCISVCCVMSSQ